MTETEPRRAVVDEANGSTLLVPTWTTGIGPTSWDGALGVVRGWPAFWQAADGVQLDEVPVEQPWATHVWAWSGDNVWARLRLDRHIHLLLTATSRERVEQVLPGAEIEPGLAHRTTSRPVLADQESFVLWPDGDRVRPLGLPTTTTWTRLVTMGSAPVTFISHDGASRLG